MFLCMFHSVVIEMNFMLLPSIIQNFHPFRYGIFENYRRNSLRNSLFTSHELRISFQCKGSCKGPYTLKAVSDHNARMIMRRLTLFLSIQQWSKQNGGWNRLCSGNPGFFKSLGCCNRLLILFKTKRVKYTAIWKKSIKIVKESKPSFFFFLHCAQCFTYPSPFSILFPSSIFFIPFSTILLFSLLNVFIPFSTIFIIFPPQCFLFPSSTSTSSFLLFSLHHHHHDISIVFPRPPLPLVVPPWGLVCRGGRVTKRVFKGPVSWWKIMYSLRRRFWLGFWKTNCRLASVAVAGLLG